jgi:dephospho-CoA kinase
MITIGITGGIGSGKSTVARMLEEKGATVVDADKLAHTLYEPESEGYDKLVSAFGPQIIGVDKKVDRKILGSIVFENEDKRRELSEIMWPLVKVKVIDLQKNSGNEGAKIFVIEAAMFVEAGWTDISNELWVVKSSKEIEIERIMNRNHIGSKEAEARVCAVGEKENCRPDVIIENNGTIEQLERKIDDELEKLYQRIG